MSSPEIRPRNNKPANGPNDKTGSPQTLRVLSDDVASHAAAPSIAMPRAKTELSELLAGDAMLCVRRRASATAMPQNAETPSSVSGVSVRPQAESPAALSGQRSPDGRPDGRDSSPPTPTVDGDLACVIEAWPGLPPNIRAAALAMIRETTTGDA